MSSKARNLVGTRFGRLQVTQRLENKGRFPQWSCVCDCGQTCVVLGRYLRSGQRRSCGCLKQETMSVNARTSAAKRTKKAGDSIVHGGYRLVRAPGHPRAWKKNNLLAEHILVMERKLGRYLLPDENVHHKNGVRDDNRPDNLELWVRPQPSGIRAEDAVAWAREILARYEGVF